MLPVSQTYPRTAHSSAPLHSAGSRNLPPLRCYVGHSIKKANKTPRGFINLWRTDEGLLAQLYPSIPAPLHGPSDAHIMSQHDIKQMGLSSASGSQYSTTEE